MNYTDSIVATLMGSTTTHMVKRIQGVANKKAYRETMELYLSVLKGKQEVASSIVNYDIDMKFNYTFLLWKRTRPGIAYAKMACQHAQDIVDSVNKRFVAGFQHEPHGMLNHRTVAVYSDE